ncbi:MAG: XRE family transcriptional regulator [Candidatus Tokpelaia sp.]|uniref:helix-turn-helix domain-containing protein n=1 Tax=Candidatus Tokpelaia sp. TaxID=2233777 RepID=UPI00123B13D9|nr:helix-turn-helix transcriptional regulator [Candidatus Tokpelaia sp.]KAA6204666.1 MAG: XRE family transcriptional regulator [Candidatus Tokpelaia sp.]KAA6206114.1 MAG: XRE family transcriptional regulator [Candidatus Tokpelaia sp.]KAA6405723.1 transcriptional regulator [Candidatus Tokpelaia sp.]
MKQDKNYLTARKILSHNIKRLREERELSQESLADLVGLHRTYIGSVERCERNISIDNIERIASVFDVSPSFLLGNNNK